MVKAFRAVGTFRSGVKNQPFTMDLVADDESSAMEYVYSNFGSRHGVKRRFVVVSSMDEIDPSESTDPRVVSAFRE
ncbi:MAG: 50S ribosomal protein L18Ae [Candidatus Thalassarchaeaceae archaeon]